MARTTSSWSDMAFPMCWRCWLSTPCSCEGYLLSWRTKARPQLVRPFLWTRQRQVLRQPSATARSRSPSCCLLSSAMSNVPAVRSHPRVLQDRAELCCQHCETHGFAGGSITPQPSWVGWSSCMASRMKASRHMHSAMVAWQATGMLLGPDTLGILLADAYPEAVRRHSEGKDPLAYNGRSGLLTEGLVRIDAVCAHARDRGVPLRFPKSCAGHPAQGGSTSQRYSFRQHWHRSAPSWPDRSCLRRDKRGEARELPCSDRKQTARQMSITLYQTSRPGTGVPPRHPPQKGHASVLQPLAGVPA